MPNKQDRKTQRLFDNVTKSLLTQDKGLKRDPETGVLYEEPLKEEHPVGSLLLLRGAGPAAAKGLEWIGEKMMPSALIKGIGQTFPRLTKVTEAVAPYADAGALSLWGAEGLQSAKEAVRNGDVPGTIAGASMAAFPLMGIRPNLAQELTRTQKANEVARALNREVKGTEIVDSPVTQNILAGKLGWAPRQSRVIWHNSESPISKLESTFPAWDTVERGAPLGHVWGTGTETNLGFIGKRPFHLRSTKPVEMNKPMVQLNESIGSGKNAVRNEILKFADQSGADAVNFSNIKDNTLSNQDVYAVFKDVDIKPKLSEAERLGIPKGERSNPKALEDSYYWGYKQWNDRYNAAVESGNVEEAQRLRDSHFLSKTTNAITDRNGKLAHNYHATKAKFTIFDPSKAGSGSGNLENTQGVFYFTPYKEASIDVFHPKGLEEYNEFNVIDAYINNPKPVIIPLEDFKKTWFNAEEFAKLRDRGTGIIGRASNTPEEIFAKELADYERLVKKYNGNPPKYVSKPTSPNEFMEESLVDNIAVTKPEFIKLADPITKTNTGEIIPIVKRDNFHNPDIRYKQGGSLKRK